ncbi:hypothetical protein ACIA8O_27015 [Kitasatospora sp. NPDC051853]|uniref:hypothetical protein n=1 Tax=Kitasatospora sp. NPDC051853 TaxID=3364058 RepID=UPI0037989FC8
MSKGADQLLRAVASRAAGSGSPVVVLSEVRGGLGMSDERFASALARCHERRHVAPVNGRGPGTVALTRGGRLRALRLEEAAKPRSRRAWEFREVLLRWLADQDRAGAVAVGRLWVEGGPKGTSRRPFGPKVDWAVVEMAYLDLAERELLTVAPPRTGTALETDRVELTLTATGRDFAFSDRSLDDFLTARQPPGASSMTIENAAIFSGPVTASAVAVGTRNTATATGNRTGTDVAHLVGLLRALRPGLDLDPDTADDFDHEVGTLERTGTDQPAAGRSWRAIRRMLPTALAAGAAPGTQQALEGAISLGTTLFGG